MCRKKRDEHIFSAFGYVRSTGCMCISAARRNNGVARIQSTCTRSILCRQNIWSFFSLAFIFLCRFFLRCRCRCCCCCLFLSFFHIVSVVTSSLIFFPTISAMRIFMLVGDCILWARACKFFKLPKKRTLQTAHRFIRYYLNAGAMHLFDIVFWAQAPATRTQSHRFDYDKCFQDLRNKQAKEMIIYVMFRIFIEF